MELELVVREKISNGTLMRADIRKKNKENIKYVSSIMRYTRKKNMRCWTRVALNSIDYWSKLLKQCQDYDHKKYLDFVDMRNKIVKEARNCGVFVPDYETVLKKSCIHNDLIPMILEYL